MGAAYRQTNFRRYPFPPEYKKLSSTEVPTHQPKRALLYRGSIKISHVYTCGSHVSKYSIDVVAMKFCRNDKWVMSNELDDFRLPYYTAAIYGGMFFTKAKMNCHFAETIIFLYLASILLQSLIRD